MSAGLRTISCRAILALLAFTFTGLLLLVLSIFLETRYHNTTTSAWFAEFRENQNDTPAFQNAVNALRALGPDALPFLTAQLRSRETHLTRLYRECSILLPWSIRNILPGLKDRDAVRNDTVAALSHLGDAAKPATPQILAMLRLENEDSYTFLNATELLVSLHTQTDDLDRIRPRNVHTESLADGIDSGKISFCESLVY